MTPAIQAAVAAAVSALIIVATEGCAPGTKIWVVADSPGHSKPLTQSKGARVAKRVPIVEAKAEEAPEIAIDDEAQPLDSISDKDRRTLARLLKALK